MRSGSAAASPLVARVPTRSDSRIHGGVTAAAAPATLRPRNSRRLRGLLICASPDEVRLDRGHASEDTVEPAGPFVRCFGSRLQPPFRPLAARPRASAETRGWTLRY